MAGGHLIVRGVPMVQPWDAFISYARAASTREAVALHQGIERFAKPWNQLRGCRVFRDDTSMSANGALWGTIERALGEARHLVLLLTPNAAASPHVDREVRWWLDHKDAATILLVHCEGSLVWDPARNDFSAETDCLPPALRGAYRDVPRWVDLTWFDQPGSLGQQDRRFPEAVADLAAPIRGTERDELVGENVTQLKKAKRLAQAGVSALAILLVAAIVTAATAVTQRNQLAQQAVTLQARQLASLADSYAATDVQRSQLFAVAAARKQDSPETRAALFRSLVSAPALQGFTTLPDDVRLLEVGQGGKAVAVALDNGSVYRIDPTRRTPPELLFDLGGLPPASLSLSADGSTVAAVASEASSETRSAPPVVRYWRNGGVNDLPLPADKSTETVAVSPHGLTIMVNGGHADGTTEGSPGLDFFDAPTGTGTFRRPDPLSGATGDFQHRTFEAAFIDDRRVTVVDTSFAWAVMRLADGAVLSRGQLQISEQLNFEFSTFTSSGLWYLQSGARSQGSTIGVWSTLEHGSTDEVPDPALTAPIEYTAIEDADATADGRWVVVSDASGLHLRQTGTPTDQTTHGTLTLTGTPVASHVAFLDAPTRLVSASGSTLAFWDTDSPGRLAKETPLTPQQPAVFLGPDENIFTLDLSPDGNSYAIANLYQGTLQRGSLPGRTGVPTEFVAPNTENYVRPWAYDMGWADNQHLWLQTAEASPNPPEWLQPVQWETDNPSTISADGTIAVTINKGAGTIDRYEFPNRRLLTSAPVTPGASSIAALNADGSVVAYEVDDDPSGRALVFADTSTGTVLHREPLTDDSSGVLVAIDGSDGVVQVGSDHAALWKDLGREGRQFFGREILPSAPASAQTNPPVVTSSHIALTTRTGTTLYTRDALVEVGSLPAPLNSLGHPRVTQLSAGGQALVVAYLGPTQETAYLTALPLDLETQRTSACATSGRQLTATEWNQLVGAGTTPDLVCS